MYKIRNFTFMIIAVVALFFARTLSEPILLAKENSKVVIGESEVLTVGNFNNNKDYNKREIGSTFKERKINYLINGMIPLIMYLLSLVCLLDLIKTTYKKFMKEDIITYKTSYLLLLVFQMSLIGLISFYVADISYETLIIWVIGAILTVQVAFHGSYLIDLVKISKER